MESLNKVISSFDLQKNLQPDIWVENGEKINPKVRKNLLEIAYQFIDTFGLDVVVDDIEVVGSIANYNWSKYSDIDLHIIVDFNQFSDSTKDLYVEFFDLKKIVFNQKRNLKMFGFDVEVYVEDSNKKGVSGGVYSLLNDEWIQKPKKEETKVKKDEIIRGTKKWMSLIDTLINNLEGEDIESIRDTIKKIKDKLKKFRLSGLQSGGELGLENLIFKVLRRNGYIEKLYSIPTEMIDKQLSLNEVTLAAPLENISVGAEFGAIRPGLDKTKPHSGTDFRASTGTPIFAPADGKVVKADMEGWNGGCGGTLYIKHDGGFESRFCHCSNIMVSVGQEVKQGEKVALVGGGKNDKGKGFSTGSHLHYTLAKGAKLVNPMDYIGGFKPITIAAKTISVAKDSVKKMIDILKKPEYSSVDLSKLKEKKKLLPFLGFIEDILKKETEFEVGKKIPFQNDLIYIQKVLKVLGYTDNDFKVTGVFDEKTKDAVENFQRDNNLTINGKLDKKSMEILYFLLLANDVTENDLEQIQVEKINEGDIPDLIVYKEILSGLDIPITENNLKFLFALRNSLEVYSAKNNPFSVKYDLPDNIKITNYENTEIKNYPSIESGIQATIKTLKLPKYRCVIDSMKNNEKLYDLITCPVLKSLGLQGKIEIQLRNKNLIPIKISK